MAVSYLGNSQIRMVLNIAIILGIHPRNQSYELDRTP